MKIAFVTQPGHAVLPAAGSLEIWTAEVARRLAGEHAVTIFASRSARTTDTTEAGIDYRFVPHTGQSVNRALRGVWRLRSIRKPFFASTLFPFSYWYGVGLQLRRGGYDVAHVFNYSQALPILRRLAPDTKLVLHMQCEWLLQLDQRMLARRLKHAHAILACSDALTNGARERFPAVAHRCHTVPNGTDLDALDFERNGSADPSRLLYVGRISPEKGLHVLMDAFDALFAERPGLQLTLVGEEASPPPEMLVRLAGDEKTRQLESFYAGSYLAALRARLSPAAAEHVHFTGAVPYAQVAEQYRDADMFVFPSYMEAFGMPLAEALASGLPAIGARTGGIVDIIDDGVTGLLVESGDTAGLIGALRRLLDEPELRRSLAAAGRRKARERFSWDHVAAATERHFAGAAAAH